MKRARETARVAAAQGTSRKAIGAQWLVVITSASLLSLFIVMPYTYGYFSYVDITYLPFFSIADYYLFSVQPLLAAVLLFGLQYYLSHQGGRFTRDIASRFRPGRRRSGWLRPSAGIMLLAALILAILVAAHLSLGLIIVLCALLVLALLIFVSVARQWHNLAFYALVFVFSELFLISWGYLNAYEAFQERREVTIKADKDPIPGFLFFAGGQGVFLIDEKGPFFVHFDSGTLFRTGVVQTNEYVGGCTDWGAPIREIMWKKCLRLSSLAILRKQESSRTVVIVPLKKDVLPPEAR